MYDLPEKFKKYLPKVQERRKAVLLAQSKIDRLNMMINLNKEGLESLNSTGTISAEVAAARRGYQSRIEELRKSMKEAQEALADAQGVNEVVVEAIAKMKI